MYVINTYYGYDKMEIKPLYFKDIIDLRDAVKKDLQLDILVYLLTNRAAHYSDIMKDVGMVTGAGENTIRSSIRTLTRMNLLRKVVQPGGHSPIYTRNFILKENTNLYDHRVVQAFLSRFGRLELTEEDFRPKDNEEALLPFLSVDGLLSALIRAYSISDPKIMKEIAIFKELFDIKIKNDLENNNIIIIS